MTEDETGLTKYRVKELERKVDKLQAAVEKLMTNHIPYLQEDILTMKTRINIMTAINIGGIILGIIVAKFLK